jgi:membrane protease YdiL (CAAX protease family)
MNNFKVLTRILIFYVIAILLSNIVRFELFGIEEFYESLSLVGKFAFSPLGSLGVLIGSIISLSMLRKNRRIIYSLFGNSRKWSVLMCLVLPIIFAIVGVENTVGINPHLLGIFVAISALLYAFFEEYGWRGYLEDELGHISEWKRVLLITVLWFIWHLTFIEDADLLINLQFFALLLLGSWGLGRIIRDTKSIFVASCFHSLYNIIMIRQTDTLLISSEDKMWIIGLCIGLWVFIIKKWTKESKLKPHE